MLLAHNCSVAHWVGLKPITFTSRLGHEAIDPNDSNLVEHTCQARATLTRGAGG